MTGLRGKESELHLGTHLGACSGAVHQVVVGVGDPESGSGATRRGESSGESEPGWVKDRDERIEKIISKCNDEQIVYKHVITSPLA